MASSLVQDRRAHLLRDAVMHRWRWMAAGTALGLVVAVLLLLLAAGGGYAASAQVLVTPVVGNSYSPEEADLESMDSEAQIVTSDVVVRQVAQDLGLEADSPLLTSNVSVEVVPNTQVLVISVRGSDADQVTAATNAFAATYLEVRSGFAQDLVTSRARGLREEIRATEDRLRQAARAAETAETAAERAVQRRLAEGYQTDLFDQRATLTEILSTATGSGRILSLAEEAVAGSPVRRFVPALAALLAGVGIGVVGAVVRERDRDRVRRAGDVQDLGVSILGDLGTTDVSDGWVSADAFRRLRIRLLDLVDPPAVLVVTSPGLLAPSWLATGLARTLSHVPLPTTMVQAADGPFDELAQGQPAAGLSEALLEDRDPHALLVALGDSLELMSPGHSLDRARDRFVPDVLRALLHRLRGSSRLVLVHARALEHPDGEALAAVADVVILTVVRDTSTHAELERALASLQRHEVPVVCAVVVDAALLRPGLERVSPAPGSHVRTAAR